MNFGIVQPVGRPFTLRRPDEFFDVVYSWGVLHHSPDTARAVSEARQLFSAFSDVKIVTVLGHGDLLTSQAGQRHGGWVLTAARRLWPRRFLARFARGFGLAMLIEASK